MNSVATRSPKNVIRGALISILAFSALVVAGCGYQFGSPNQPYIRSVYVPIFQSGSFRRGVEFQLTEAVQQEIKQRTPFRLATEHDADTILRGELIEVRKDVLGETQQDDPRELQLGLAVAVTWEDARSGRILGQQRIPIGADLRHVVVQSDFAPELGQSMATATQAGVNRLAARIVDLLEMPW